jgi:hypothetical protein
MSLLRHSILPTLITPTLNTSTVTDNLCNSGAISNPNAVRDCPFNLKGHGFYPGVGFFFRMGHSVSASFSYIIKILVFIIAVSYDNSHAYDQFKSTNLKFNYCLNSNIKT